MPYIPYSATARDCSGEKSYMWQIPKNGVVLGKEKADSTTFTVSKIGNIDVKESGIYVRKGKKKLSESIRNMGTLYSITDEPFCGKIIMHIGSCLYSYSYPDSTLSLISDTLYDEKSLFCTFLSRLYIYCAHRVFALDNDFVLTEEEPEPALVYESLSPVYSSPGKMLDTSLNLISPVISVRYTSTLMNSFKLPFECDMSRRVKIFYDDEEIPTEGFTFTQTQVTVHSPYTKSEEKVATVTYYVKNPEDIGYEDVLYGCEKNIAFGGNASGGTRIIFTGNCDRKGYYYKSELRNPLFVGSKEYEIIGDGCENVTALIKMYGNLIVFTERSVFRMSYVLKEDGAYFSVKELTCQVGCDCPKSVQLIDNRVVFANSKKGLFIVDSTGEADEQNVKPISSNILSGEGMGLLECAEEELISAVSVDFDRNYMLCVGEKVYIWDYDSSAFSDYGNYGTSQKKLAWYIYDGICAQNFYEKNGELFFLSKNDGKFYGFSNDSDERVKSEFKSQKIDFSYPFSEKVVQQMQISLKALENTKLELVMYADGEMFAKKSIPFKAGEKCLVKIKLPKKKLYDFAFEIDGEGYYEADGFLLKYSLRK